MKRKKMRNKKTGGKRQESGLSPPRKHEIYLTLYVFCCSSSVLVPWGTLDIACSGDGGLLFYWCASHFHQRNGQGERDRIKNLPWYNV